MLKPSTIVENIIIKQDNYMNKLTSNFIKNYHNSIKLEVVNCELCNEPTVILLDTLNMLSDRIPIQLFVGTNQIMYHLENNYDEYKLFSIMYDGKLIGATCGKYLNKSKSFFIDYLTYITPKGISSIDIIFNIINNVKYEYPDTVSIVTEVESSNKALLRYARINGFKNILKEYYQIQPNDKKQITITKCELLGMSIHPSYIIKEDDLSIVGDIYLNHYLKWYSDIYGNDKLVSDLEDQLILTFSNTYDNK